MFNLHSLGVEGQEGKGDAGNTTHVTAMFKYEFLSWGPGPAATYVEFHTIGTIPGAFETHGLNYLTIKSLCTPMILEHSLSAKKTQTNISYYAIGGIFAQRVFLRTGGVWGPKQKLRKQLLTRTTCVEETIVDEDHMCSDAK